jgi:hypothetical protein
MRATAQAVELYDCLVGRLNGGEGLEKAGVGTAARRHALQERRSADSVANSIKQLRRFFAGTSVAEITHTRFEGSGLGLRERVLPEAQCRDREQRDRRGARARFTER